MSDPKTSQDQNSEDEGQPLGVRRNTVVALIFLLIAIAIAGTLGVIRIYQMTG
jgi:hypothetical protein